MKLVPMAVYYHMTKWTLMLALFRCWILFWIKIICSVFRLHIGDIYSIKLSRNVFLLINFVVAIINSTLFSSCCDRNRNAEISAKVQPPRKNTIITLGESDWEISLLNEPRRPLTVGCVDDWYSSNMGPGMIDKVSFSECHPFGFSDCSIMRIVNGA